MKTQDAITEIVRAGKEAEAIELIEKAASTAERRYRAIREQTQYTKDALNQMLRVEHDARREALNKELTALASRVGYSDRGDYGRAFGTVGIPGDAATLVVSMRDAQDRVSDINSREELLGLVRRATRTGDEVLARATAQRAMELHYGDVLNEFLETRHELDSALERIWNAQQREVNPFEWTMRISALKPAGV